MSQDYPEHLTSWQTDLIGHFPFLFTSTFSYLRWLRISNLRYSSTRHTLVTAQHLFAGRYWLNVWERSRKETLFSLSLSFSYSNVEFVALRLRDREAYIVSATPYSIPIALIGLDVPTTPCQYDEVIDVLGYTVSLGKLRMVLQRIDASIDSSQLAFTEKPDPCILHGLTNNLGHYIWNNICGLFLFIDSLCIEARSDGLSYYSGDYDFLDLSGIPPLIKSVNSECFMSSIAIDSTNISFVGTSKAVFVRPAAIYLSKQLVKTTSVKLDHYVKTLDAFADGIGNYSHIILFTIRTTGNRQWLNSHEAIINTVKGLPSFPKPLFVIDGLSSYGNLSSSSAISTIKAEEESASTICDFLHQLGFAAKSLVGIPLSHKLPYYKHANIAVQPIGSSNIIPAWIYRRQILAFGQPDYISLAKKQQLNITELGSNVCFLDSAAVLSAENGDLSVDSSKLRDEITSLLSSDNNDQKSSFTTPQTMTDYSVSPANLKSICASCSFDHTNTIVLMPIRNDIKYLHEAIQSVRDQIHADWLLFVLDASDNDLAEEVVSLHSNHDSRIHYLRFPSGSHPAERIDSFIDIHAEKCKYFAFQHSDDISYTIRLRDQVAFMDLNMDIDISSACYRSFIHDRYHEPRTNDCDAIHTKPLLHDDIVSQFPFWWVMHVPTLFFRSDIAKRTGYRFHSEYRLIGDYFANLKMYKTVRFANLPQALSAYRIHFLNDGYVHKKGLLEEESKLVRYSLDLIGAPTNDRSVSLHRSIKLLPGRTIHLESLGEFMELFRWLQLLKIYNKRSLAFPLQSFNRTIDYLIAMSCMSASSMFAGKLSEHDAYNLKSLIEEGDFRAGTNLSKLNVQ